MLATSALFFPLPSSGPLPPVDFPPPIMAPRVMRELPPALQTRQSNKNKVVGAPDMPKIRRKPEEVAEEKAAKAAAKEQSEKVKDAGRQRVTKLQAALGEDAPTILRTTRAAAKVQPSVASPRTDEESEAIERSASRGLRPAGPSPMPTRTPRLEADDEDTANHEEHELRDEAGSPAPGDDDYLPAEDNDGESEGSSMDVDNEEDEGDDGRRKKGKEKAGGKKRRARKGMGKRKLDELEESEGPITPMAAGKKAKSAAVRTKMNKSNALVADWLDVAQPPRFHERSSSPPPAYIPDVEVPHPRSTSRLSTASSVPPSTAGDTTDSDALGLGEGEGAIDDDAATYPEPRTHDSSRIRVSDVRDALRYRSQQLKPGKPLAATSGSDTTTPASRALPEVTAPLTKVSAPKTQAPGGDKNPPVKSEVVITVPKKKRHRRNAGAGAEDAKSKATISDLPPEMQRPFANRFMPIARQFAGSLDPWTDIKFTELQVIHRRAFGTLADIHPLEEDDKCHKLIQSKISDWRAKFALSGMETWKEILMDPDLQEVFSTPEAVGEYAVYLLGDGKAAAPFFWKEWNGGEKKIGRLQGELIIGSLASHIAEMVNVPGGERNEEMPRGALGMATLAAMHTLSHYKTGQWKPPSGRAGWFSGDNYGDSVVFVDGRSKSDKKLTRIMKVVDNLDAKEWLEIIDAARAVMTRRQTAPGKRTKGRGAATAATVAPDDVDSSDSDVMLTADA